jgi:hypothetical protein
MTRTIILLLALISNSYSYGQKAIVSTENTEYKTNEEIEIEYEINQIVDSIIIMKQDGFYLIKYPLKISGRSTIDEITTYKTQYIHHIIAIQPGELKIPSPTFYINGIAIKADSIILNITGEKLNSAQLKEIEFKIFKRQSFIPEGTTRVTSSDKYGFIEEYHNSDWHIVRKLTDKEIRKYYKLEKAIHLID